MKRQFGKRTASSISDPDPDSRGGEIVVNGTVTTTQIKRRSPEPTYRRQTNRHPQKESQTRKSSFKSSALPTTTSKMSTCKIPIGCLRGCHRSLRFGKILAHHPIFSTLLFPIICTRRSNNTGTSVGAYKEIKGLEHIDKVIAIDQSPIGRNPRSNPATYIKVFDEIRDLFSSCPKARRAATSRGASAST